VLRAKLRRDVRGLRKLRPRPTLLQRAVQEHAAPHPGPGRGTTVSGKRVGKASPLPKAAGLQGASRPGTGDASSYGIDHGAADSSSAFADSMQHLRVFEPLDQRLLWDFATT